MTIRSRAAILLSLLTAFLRCATAPVQTAAPPPAVAAGVVAVDVIAGSALQKAGVEKGDVLLSWSRGEVSGELHDPFELRHVIEEQLPLGALTLTLSRNGTTLTKSVPPGFHRGTYRPQFTEEHLTAYREGRTDAARIRALVPDVAAREGEAAAVWLLADAAQLLAQGTDTAAIGAAYDEAIARAKNAHLDIAAAQIAETEGNALMRRNDMAGAEKAFRDAIAMRRALGSEIGVGTALSAYADFAMRRRDAKAAEEALHEALAIYQRVAPASRETAQTLNALAKAAFFRGDIPTAESFFQRSLELQEKVAPGGYEYASNLNGLGVAAFQRGDLAAADSYWSRALAVMEQLRPDSPEVASILNNVAAVAKERGDYATADKHMRRVLALREKLVPDSLEVAEALNNLGNLAVARQELEEGETILARSLALRQKLAPESLDTAHSLNNLGDLALERGRYDDAQRYFEQSLALQTKLGARSIEVARDYNDLASVAIQRGDAKSAQQQIAQALAIIEERAPGGLDAAETLHRAAEAAVLAHDLTAADQQFRRALDIRERLAPGSEATAETLYRLGLVARDRHHLNDAADLLRRAIDTLASQTARLGGSDETKAGFLARYANYYHDLIDVLLQLGRRDEAFHVLERSRAQRLLTMLAERDLVFADVPANLDRARKAADHEYDVAQQQLATLNPATDGEKIQELRTKLRDIRARQEDVVEQIRRESPRLAALKYPQALDVAAASRTLDRGTLLLSYSVGPKSSVLFVLESADDARGRSPLSVVRIAAGDESLRKEVRRFRNLIERGARKDDARELQTRARELTQLLLPAKSAIARAQRVLVSPDGPLHLLPFSALASPSSKSRFVYLAEEKPVHVVLSATVYAELRKERDRALPANAVDLAAFGDAHYPAADHASTDPVVRSLVTRYSLEPLPATRQEVVKIASLFGDSALQYLGDAAREETAKEVAGRARYLHFASHGVVDEDFPLDSALALSIPDAEHRDRDNGLLQAWEIFESLRIPADLVVLSACETALGKPTGGEGLVGLTRAFQYAGARSVLASLWSVSDTSTAQLMEHFYGALRAGKSKDEALRAAQMQLMRNGDASVKHPYHWAAFELVGDWR
ncbi:MAG: CHAT domain-containing protein [Acidobacteriota bacterium]|nr:CHAT domain-containing protein [Acidobacteriota bacterium]